ncbi:MAG: hypothetical protein ABJA79_07995 [Parafilimonas sp.]
MNQEVSATKEITLYDAVNSLKKLFRYLLSKWLIIGLIALAGGVVGVTYAWLLKMKYEAVLTFTTDEEAISSNNGLLSLASQFGFNIGGGSGGVFSGENLLALLRSQKIITGSLLSTVTFENKTERLLNIYMESEGIYKSFRSSEKYKNLNYPVTQDPATFSRLQDSVLLLITKDISESALSVEQPDEDVQIYKLTCVSKSEFFSKAFAEEMMKQVSDFYIESKTKRFMSIVNILQSRADSVKREFNSALYGRASLSDANINPAFQMPTVGIQKKQTDITVLGTAYGEIVKNLELAKFNLLRQTPLIQIIDEPLLPLKQIKPGRFLTGMIMAFVFGMIAIMWLTLRKVFAPRK